MGEPNVGGLKRVSDGADYLGFGASSDSATFDTADSDSNGFVGDSYEVAKPAAQLQTLGDKYSLWDLSTEVAEENFNDAALGLGVMAIGISVLQPELAPAAVVLAGIGIVGYTGLGFAAGCVMYPFMADQPLTV